MQMFVDRQALNRELEEHLATLAAYAHKQSRNRLVTEYGDHQSGSSTVQLEYKIVRVRLCV